MTDNELLLSLSDLFDKKLKPIGDELSSLKGAVDSLKGEVDSLKGEVDSLKGEVDSLKEEVNLLKEKIVSIEKKINTMEKDIKLLKMQNENDILPRLQNIESCYTSTYDRYKNSVEKFDAMQTDIDIMKKVITEHSEKLQKIC